MTKNVQDFIRLSSAVSLLDRNPHVLGTSASRAETASSTTTSRRSNSPDTVIVLSWMGAHPRHVTKYTSAYSKLYPNARILLITVSWADFFHRQPIQSSSTPLQPALSTLLARPDEKRLVHLFSNGGSRQLNLLNAGFRNQTGRVLPIQALVLDSAPGRATFWLSVWTILLTLPRQWYLRPPLFVLSFLVVLSSWLVRQLSGAQDVIEQVRRDLNDNRLMSQAARRCYVYSDADESVAAGDVEEHADEARRKGWIVSTEKFVGSAHVGHVRLDSTRYWRIVEDLWNQCCGTD